MRTIVVSSNCQTGGIAAALQEIFWKDKVSPIPYPSFTDDQLLNEFSKADILITSGRFDLVDRCLTSNQSFYKFPEIYFAAFHPDLIYVKKISTNEFATPHYNSALCVWAYKNGLDITNTMALFTPTNFNKLGYFSQYKASVDRLSESFKNSGLPVNLFLPNVVRHGVFMHSVNHSKVSTLVRLAKVIAMQIDPKESFLHQDINISDGLTDTVWPVYPEIADFYALTGGSYNWKIQSKMIHGLNNYIEYSFDDFKRQGIERDDIKFADRDESIYDRVLGPVVGVNND